MKDSGLWKTIVEKPWFKPEMVEGANPLLIGRVQIFLFVCNTCKCGRVSWVDICVQWVTTADKNKNCYFFFSFHKLAWTYEDLSTFSLQLLNCIDSGTLQLETTAIRADHWLLWHHSETPNSWTNPSDSFFHPLILLKHRLKWSQQVPNMTLRRTNLRSSNQRLTALPLPPVLKYLLQSLWGQGEAFIM